MTILEEDEMKMTKTMISELNKIAQEDFDKAQVMLDGINLVMGTKYDWLNRRVVFFDEPDCATCIKYRNAHDAYAYAKLT